MRSPGGLDRLPESWQNEIKRLRAENARYRRNAKLANAALKRIIERHEGTSL